MPGGCSPDWNSPKSTIYHGDCLCDSECTLLTGLLVHTVSQQILQVRDGVEMTTEQDISAEMTQLAEFAEREDWLYQAELSLAAEFSRAALAFAEANPEAEVICKDYIGEDSALRYSARSSLLRSIKSIEKSLDKLQGFGTMYKFGEGPLDYFALPTPATAFFESEIRRRNMTRLGG